MDPTNGLDWTPCLQKYMESHYRRRIRSWITGHHAYKNIWSPTIGEELDHG